MRTPSSLLAVVVASFAALVPSDARADGAAFGATPGASVTASAWTFTKSPAPWARRAVRSPAPGLEALVFDVTAAVPGSARLTRVAFLVTGTARNAEVARFQLVHYSDGLGSPGIVVGSNDGASWAPGRSTSLVSIALTAPIDLQGDFTGVFALRVDVSGARPFDFQPQLRTLTIERDGLERFVTETEDLPLHGDSFYVN